jgi:hypothetical protein
MISTSSSARCDERDLCTDALGLDRYRFQLRDGWVVRSGNGPGYMETTTMNRDEIASARAVRTAEDERADVVAWLRRDVLGVGYWSVPEILDSLDRGAHVGAAEIWSQSEIDACHQEGAERGAKLRAMTGVTTSEPQRSGSK